MNIDPQEKMITKEPKRIEKYIMRKAFDPSVLGEGAQPYLPEKILWRQKEQFSDGVGYGWIDALKDNAELHVTDEMMKNPKKEWGSDIPDTKEAYVFRVEKSMNVANKSVVIGIGRCSMSISLRIVRRQLCVGLPPGRNRRILVEGLLLFTSRSMRIRNNWKYRVRSGWLLSIIGD
jgi:hypothetical protein